MSERAFADNARYLSAALASLRARLERQAASADGSAPADVDAAAAELAAARAACVEPPWLETLAQICGLSEFEQQVLLLCAAAELDTRVPDLCARAQGTTDRQYPTFALALALFDDAAWDVVAPDGPLRHWHLIEVTPAGEPLTASPLRADERVVSYLKGLNYLDPRVASLLAPPAASRISLPAPESHQRLVTAVAGQLSAAERRRERPTVELLGPARATKQLVAADAADALQRHLLRLPAEMLPQGASELDALRRLLDRECELYPSVLYLDLDDLHDDHSHGPAGATNRLVSRLGAPVIVGAGQVRPRLEATTLTLDVVNPAPGEQRDAWQAALGTAAGGAPELLSSQFDLDLPAIARIAGIAGDAGDELESTGGAPADRLWQDCRAATRPRLDGLAQRIESSAGWDDIVLPPDELDALRRITDQVATRGQVYEQWGFGRRLDRGRGITALFAGESGTGKTMAAGVIARALRLDLYRIDLSAVINKYIGETEKNLRRLFDAAEGGGTILFFDEADALFGKRSDVKDSHDRYANIEVNYLLQRMEAYRGLAILATNMKRALDAAFMRRLRFVVTFPVPGPAQRRAIWARSLPRETPRAELDLDRLARFALTGGSIQNAALNAAFAAAAGGGRVTMPLVLAAVKTELRKLELPIVDEGEFEWHAEPAGVAA